jgi:putative endonuclease
MFFVYVIQNQSSGRLYTGFTRDLTQRLGQHNSGITKSTKGRGPWDLVYSEPHSTRAGAMRREKFLKSGKGREELQGILTAKSMKASAG